MPERALRGGLEDLGVGVRRMRKGVKREDAGFLPPSLPTHPSHESGHGKRPVLSRLYHTYLLRRESPIPSFAPYPNHLPLCSTYRSPLIHPLCVSLTCRTVAFNSLTARSTRCNLPRITALRASGSPMASRWAYCTALSTSRTNRFASLAAAVEEEQDEDKSMATASLAWLRPSSSCSIAC